MAIVDLFSRNVLSWKLLNTLDTGFFLTALKMTLASGRKPAILHSDQSYQFTPSDFVSKLQTEEIKIRWSGRKRSYDNILVERLWRTIKYVAEGFSTKRGELYQHDYTNGWEAEISLAGFLWNYCHVMPHSSLEGKTPHEIYKRSNPIPADRS